MPSAQGMERLEVQDAPLLSTADRERQSIAARRLVAEQFAGIERTELRLVCSVLVGAGRYDCWWTPHTFETALEPVLPGLEARPLQAFFFHVRRPDARYWSAYLGPPFPDDGVADLPPERAAVRLAIVDHLAYDGRCLELAIYRRWASARPDQPDAQYELAVMIWFHHFTGSPGPVEEAEPPLRRAIERKPKAHAYHGLLGEVLLRAGRIEAAAAAFAQAARLHPGHPRYHYCLSVASEKSGDAVAAKRALVRAKRVAGPKLKKRFTRGSNPLEDYRTSLMEAAVRLRVRREGLARPSARDLAERVRAENLIERSEVPDDLHELVPLVEKWGLGDEPAREYFVKRATRAEKQELRQASRRHERRILEWIDSLEAGAPTQASTCFLYFLDACDELGIRRTR